MAFAHLHNRSQFSLLDGAMSPEELAARAAKLGQTSVALTDTCNLYGAVSFWKACKDEKIHHVLGASLWVWPPGLDQLDPRRDVDGGYDLVLLIEDVTGYKNLCKLITTAIFGQMHYRPRVDLALLTQHKDGLIALTSGLWGPLGHHARGDSGRAREELARLADIFGPDHLYVELQDYGLPGQPELCTRGRSLASELGLRAVVTNDCRYLEPTDAVTLDLLNAIARGENLDDAERQGLPTDQQYLKTEAEMRALFPEDGDALDRTVEIAERCHFKYKTDTYHFPAARPPDPTPEGGEAPDTEANWRYFYAAYPPPRDFGMPAPEEGIPPRPPGTGNLNGYFEWYARRGLELRLRDVPEDQHPAYWKQLDYETRVIEQMGFPAYMLIVAEFINWAKDQAIPVGPGRGSAAGSLVAYVLRITDIDPIRFNLLFERFLNPERVSMPDIDVDFCQDRREEVITHVKHKYGEPLVSQIITYGKLQAKAALKDIARICGVGFDEADRIAKLVPNELNITLDKALEDERFKALAGADPLVARVVSLARRVEGMTRQTGVHAAGVVIADQPLVHHAPLYRDGPDGGPVVQYDMKSAETVGLIKFDFLGLKTLDQIRDAIAMVQRNTGEKVDLEHIPLDDEPTYAMLQRGDALGVFQVESSGMRELLAKVKPTCLDDLVALNALYRPGPLSSGMVDDFIERKHGRKSLAYPHPWTEPILASTYGVIVYQEQVMQIAQVLSGYSLGEADLLRRAMGKKKPEEMAKQKSRFLSGARDKGVDEKVADEIFDLLALFAGYGFNKSHSAAYGLVCYQTAFLKAHHRAEYMAALMSIESGNTDKILSYISDCKRHGVTVLPPDVNHSASGFDVPASDRRTIRFGLAAVKGVGEGAVEAILEARAAAGGAFSGFMDCLERLDYRRVNKKVLENLIKCGAFDWTGTPRRALFEGLTAAMSAAQSTAAERAAGQMSLFGAMKGPPRPTLKPPDVGEWPTGPRLTYEREALGFFITGHPLEEYEGVVERLSLATVARLDVMPGGDVVGVAGMVTSFREIKTKTGTRMAFATVEDQTGAVECVFFSDAYAKSQRALTADQPVRVKGKLERGEEGNKILAEEAELLAEIRERRTREVHLHLNVDWLENGRLEGLTKLLKAASGGRPVYLHLRVEGLNATWIGRLPSVGVAADDSFKASVEEIFPWPDIVEFR